MKKIYLFFLILLININININYCLSKKSIKRKAHLRNNLDNTNTNNIKDEWYNDNTENVKDLLKKEEKRINKHNNPTKLNDHNIKNEKRDNNSTYSFMSLNFIPFIGHQSGYPHGTSIPPNEMGVHFYNFEKSPTIQYMLIDEERKNSFLYIIFLVVSFTVVVLVAFFIFKFFFKL
ncbi:apical rhoptry neck protein, putative [Plasmodium vinckei brucechwatti]|uniref:Apical rhoptry neck protein, putative n=1 Tax=Plasmodium vinckei brucechwatti TaxID=119398 RepID=A0A6V7SA03_PLAVN|nr:apical rhoptry neck protein, putative [Plasmodium vinckei brucechwatti]